MTGEPVVIPYRIYNPEPSPSFIAGLSHLEKLVAAGIYSRYKNSADRVDGLRRRERPRGLPPACDRPVLPAELR